MLPLSSTAADIAYFALSFFLIAIGLTLGYALVRLAGVLRRVSSLIGGVEKEIVPVINKAGGSIDRVNDQLDKLDVVTDSAVGAVESIDTVLRTIAAAVKLPAKKLAALTAGLVHGLAALRAEHDLSAAMAAARFAAKERERRFGEEFSSAAEEGEPESEE
ncbi:MAG: DUF948 domain-containing protein [Gaiellaceae bacterium]|jgi:uncharacterized protein YoxC